MPNLVGIGLSQVPTNSMLGGLAYQDPEHASIKDLDLKNLSQINSEIADTAVDVFVYDTRNDSDGGAWRKRTQHTSWYNETLGTSVRGTRREFPAVAVLVLETGYLKIYDGDDPDLPMWMVLNATSSSLVRAPFASSVAMLNAKLVVTDGNNYAGSTIDFLLDDRDADRDLRQIGWNGNIADRNDTSKQGIFGTTLLASQTVNDVAMTVLPNAPIDETTGLPIPTIAVATNSGASFIRDDGNVYDYTFSSQNGSKVWEITFDENHQVNMLLGYSNVYPYTCYQAPVPSKDTSLTSTTNHRLLTNATFNFNQIAYNADNTPGDLIAHFIDSKYFATTHGLSFLTPDRNNIGGQMLANITTEFNSGWMQGDIKGAFLSDTDDTNLSGGNKVTNGSAWSGAQSSQSSTAPTGWTGGNGATWKAETGNGADGTYIRLYNENNGGGGPNSYMYQAITTVAGKKYKISLTQIHHATISVYFYAGTTAGGNQLLSRPFNSSSSNTPRYLQDTFTATGTTTYITLGIISGTHNYGVGWDDVVVTEFDEDRSVNKNGLHSYGTVPKQVVATGADLVSYGGFSNNNYLRQPYNSDLRFEQNDFSIMFWIYDTGVNEHTTIISKDEREFDISRLGAAYGNKLRIYTKNSSEDLRAPDSTSALPFGRWVCVCVTYTGGNTKKVYIDGELDTTITGTNGEYDIDSTTYGLNIGVRNTGGTNAYSATGAKLALMRISGTAPSAEQIKKIYNDEKHLFEENSKATLYGSSDPVTALAYDDSNNVLHVGTSSGRSEFQGLRRINNTTTAVTTAISASNGLVAEQ